MDVSWNAFRICFSNYYKRELTFKGTHDNFTRLLLGSLLPPLATVTYWFREFKRDRENLNDDPRLGRSPTAVTHENIIRLEWLLREKRHITHREIEAALKIGSQAD